MKNISNKKSKLHIKKGDTVKILAGNDRGKSGKVLEVLVSKRRAIVEGINMVTKHMKPSAANPNGGIEKMEAAIHISNLMLVDPSSGEPTRTGRKLNDKGKLQRYSKKTREFIKNG
jgi:large subunit ribosomal protein L24